VKKKSLIWIFGALLIAAAATNASMNLLGNSAEIEVNIANIEALASGEYSPELSCWQTVSTLGDTNLTHVTFCGSCGPVLCRTWSSPGICK